jgi:hypothetical protein|tara:strand:- start:135 stop:239 length:105 start_codon:yes stop_codon:yes gene_type:complete
MPYPSGTSFRMKRRKVERTMGIEPFAKKPLSINS